MTLPISCFIIAQNESDRIGRTIRSVRALVDEIIVIDSGSTDGTQDIAAAEGAKVIHQDWQGFGRQKQIGETLCRNDWVLNIDADEVVTPALAAQMREVFASGTPEEVAYGLWVHTVYPGQQQPRPWGRDHYCVRLYDRRHVGFSASALHDSVELKGNTAGHLSNGLHHFSFRSLQDLIDKSEKRADYYARHTKPKARWKLSVRTVTEFPVNFLKYYFGRGHITGGVMGFRIAVINAHYRKQRIARALQHQYGLTSRRRVSESRAPSRSEFTLADNA